MYYLQLFGRVQLTDPQGVVIGGSKRLLQLLVIACLSKRPRSTGEIANLLWPNVEVKRRQQSFRQAMYKLNRAAPGIITVTNQRVAVDRQIITTDLDQIEDAEKRGDVDRLFGLIRGEFLPVAVDGGTAHEQWVDAQYAEYWTPMVQRVRTHFQALARAAEWQTAVEQYRRLRPPLADDVIILTVAIRSLIYSAESVTLRRDVTELIRHLRRLNRKQAERLSALLERRLRWDKRAKLHVGPVYRKNRRTASVHRAAQKYEQ